MKEKTSRNKEPWVKPKFFVLNIKNTSNGQTSDFPEDDFNNIGYQELPS